jgi:hypothetical protein
MMRLILLKGFLNKMLGKLRGKNKAATVSNWIIFLFGLSVIIAHLIMSESIPIYIVFLAWLNGFFVSLLMPKRLEVYVCLTKERKDADSF